MSETRLDETLLPEERSPRPGHAAPGETGPKTGVSFYRPELDCLRFFAFLAVFIHHTIPKTYDFYESRGLPRILADLSYAGAFGVDLFFCLSAYLITELLLRERQSTGTLNVKAFYIRRILRIWPLYFFFVLFSFGLTFLVPSQHFKTVQLAMFLLLAGNWAELFGEIESCVAPLWSVSIEEQFYLFWPLIIRKASKTGILWICGIMVAIAYVWRGYIQGHVASPHMLIWNGTFSHFDSIAYGIALATIGARYHLSWVTRGMLIALSAFVWVAAAVLKERGDVMMALVGIGSIALLQAVIGLDLRSRVLVKLGIISYGLYVFHELFLQMYNRILPNTHGLGFVLWWIVSLVSTIATALLSYRYLEKPFLKMKEKFAIVRSRPV